MERELFAAGHLLVAGMDEVGRGALAGPVSVGLVVVASTTPRRPAGLRDSKLLSPAARQALRTPLRTWCLASAIGHAPASEIDELGLTNALRVAGLRALAEVRAAGIAPDALVLDGTHDWLSSQPTLFEQFDELVLPRVHTRAKADMTSAVVAAASVLAKCERDEHMMTIGELHPHFAWDSNKGYASAHHAEMLRVHGPTPYHRRSWRLPVTAAEAATMVSKNSEDEEPDEELDEELEEDGGAQRAGLIGSSPPGMMDA